MRLQALLPLLIHSGEPRSALVVGFGTGITAGALLADPGLKTRVVAELLPSVVRAATFFSGNLGAGTELVVDDDASVRKALRRLFHATGHTVETFATAAEFLAHERPSNAGCLVLDIRMPGISGLELQKQLAASHADLPVVVITSYGDDAVRQRALENSAIAVLDNPFDDQALLDAVERAMARGRSS